MIAAAVRSIVTAVLIAGGLAPSALAGAQNLAVSAWIAAADPRDFGALWQEAWRWAAETGAAAEDCVFSFRFDPATSLLRNGYSVTCEEPYRSPFYPWPERSRVGVRATAVEVERYAQEAGPRYLRRAGALTAEEVFDACGLVVGFTGDGHGAEAIEALRPGYYFGGEHCFKGTRDTQDAHGSRSVEWLYGPCDLRPDEYWVFELYPPGKRTTSHGPYREHAQCESDRRRLKTARPGVVSGQCLRKSRAALRMLRDGTLVRPADAPAID